MRAVWVWVCLLQQIVVPCTPPLSLAQFLQLPDACSLTNRAGGSPASKVTNWQGLHAYAQPSVAREAGEHLGATGQEMRERWHSPGGELPGDYDPVPDTKYRQNV